MKPARGLTLVEVLVALVLLALVCAAALGFIARGRAAQRGSESEAVLQETLDAAFALLADEVRMAGYLGLAPPGTPVDGAAPVTTAEPAGLAVAGACGASLAHDLARPLVVVDGAYQAGAGVALGCAPTPGGHAVTGSDTLLVRRAAALATAPVAGRLQLETTLQGARLVADGAGRLGSAARWHDLEASVFYVSADSTGRPGWPSLRRKRLVGGTRPAFQDEELVSGIGELQVEPLPDDTGALPRALRLTLVAWSDVAGAVAPGAREQRRASQLLALRNGGVRP